MHRFGAVHNTPSQKGRLANSMSWGSIHPDYLVRNSSAMRLNLPKPLPVANSDPPPPLASRSIQHG
jgi:hypothetical protein